MIVLTKENASMMDYPEPKEWAVVQLRLNEFGKPPAKWGKPLAYSVESEASLQDFTGPHGDVHCVHVVKRGFPTEHSANEWIRELGIL
jgi:hypothetical protein